MIPNGKNKVMVAVFVLLGLIGAIFLFTPLFQGQVFNINSYLDNRSEIQTMESGLGQSKEEVDVLNADLKRLKDEEEVVQEQASTVREKVDQLNTDYQEGLDLDVPSLMMVIQESAKNQDVSIAFDATRFNVGGGQGPYRDPMMDDPAMDDPAMGDPDMDDPTRGDPAMGNGMPSRSAVGVELVRNEIKFSGRYLDVMEHIKDLENIDFISVENIFFVNSTLTGEYLPEDIDKRVEGKYEIQVFYFDENGTPR